MEEFSLDIEKLILNELANRLDAEKSLYQFLKQAWVHIEGTTPFVGGWHLEAISEHLEAAYKREIRNLLIHVPPRSGKTSLVSIAFPAWVWLQSPSERFMYASYASSLSIEHSLKCRRLIESDWYQSRWGKIFKLAPDQNAKGFFENTLFGARISTSVGATTTGKGASILILDDPNSAQDKESEVKRESTNLWVSQVWSTRLNDPKKDVRIVVQQRLHDNDVSGNILSKDEDSDWTKLILPMEFEAARRAKTFINGKIWQDPRTKEGELLNEERFGEKEIKRFKNELGSYGYAGQYQQRPSPEEGGIIKKNWFKLWQKDTVPVFQHIIQSWDTALEARDTNAYSACTTWGVFQNATHGSCLMLLSMWRGRVEYPELRKMAQRLYNDYRDDGVAIIKPDGVHKPHLVLVEAKVSGISLVQDMMRAGIPALRFDPNKYGDKVQRVRLITPLLEAGRVFLPTRPPNFTEPRAFAEVLQENCSHFPNADSRDLVDTMTQTLLRLNATSWITHPQDVVDEEPKTFVESPFY